MCVAILDLEFQYDWNLQLPLTYHLQICYHVRSEINPDSPDDVSDDVIRDEKERMEELRGIVALHFPQIDASAEPIQEMCLQSVSEVK